MFKANPIEQTQNIYGQVHDDRYERFLEHSLKSVLDTDIHAHDDEFINPFESCLDTITEDGLVAKHYRVRLSSDNSGFPNLHGVIGLRERETEDDYYRAIEQHYAEYLELGYYVDTISYHDYKIVKGKSTLTDISIYYRTGESND